MINWKVRVKNVNFWMALIPALLLLVQYVAEIFGYTMVLDELGEKLMCLVNQVFILLAILGIVQDPTTATLYDSDQALTYEEPKR